MKRVILISLFLGITCVLIAQGGNVENNNTIFGIAGGIGIVGILAWAFAKMKKLSGKLKEIMDIPIAITKGTTNVAIQATEAVTILRSIFDQIETASKDPEAKVMDLWKGLEKQIKDGKKEFLDIPESIKDMGHNISKEVHDLFKK